MTFTKIGLTIINFIWAIAALSAFAGLMGVNIARHDYSLMIINLVIGLLFYALFITTQAAIMQI